MASWCLLVPAAFYTDPLILLWYCCLLLRCTLNGDASLYISNMMHPFRFHISLCPRCCYYQSWHHSFNMMAPVFPFICYGQETGKYFIFQAQQHIFFKKWLFSLSPFHSFLSNILCMILIPNLFATQPCSVLFFLCFSSPAIFVSVWDTGLLQYTGMFHWPYQGSC